MSDKEDIVVDSSDRAEEFGDDGSLSQVSPAYFNQPDQDQDQDQDFDQTPDEQNVMLLNNEHKTWGYGDDSEIDDLNYEREGPEEDDDELNIPGVDDLPLFSNQVAKKLNNDIREKEIHIVEYESKIADMRERVKVIKEHFKNVQTELTLTNNLHSSKRLEIQTENHLRMLTERALEREKSNAKKLTGMSCRHSLAVRDIYSS
jgi:hypothetical protein